ncbi:restriction endonuclease subunit S [Gallibacterium anatis]|uniref:restriction endonuclease subunit S n=1 Tax=Gallibacterium anatis TaxID=750 RepID=UPI0038D4857D
MSNIPKLRFPEFTDAWEKCKLGEVAEFINGKAYKQEELLNEGKYKVVRVGNFNTNEHWYYSNLELENNKYMVAGDLLYLWATDFGPKFWAGEKAIFHYHIWKLELNYKIIDKNYLYVWLETDKEKIKQSTNGTTMVHVTKSTMEKRVLSFPTLPEQQKIGTLFRRLDRLITLHKRKWDDVILLKRALLQKMFPKNGSDFPEIRFPEFTDAWEKCKLENFVEITTGKLDANAMVNDGKYDFYTSGIKKFKINIPAFTGPAITIAGNGATVGFMHLADGEFNAYQRTYVLTKFSNSIREFLFYEIGIKLPRKISAEARTGNIPYIVMDMLTNLDVFTPTVPEQQKIGNLFKQLDRLITLHKRQHEHYQLLKKALLQQMFV